MVEKTARHGEYTHSFPDAYEKLCSYRNVWKNKPVLQKVYGRLYQKIQSLLPISSQAVIELGGGTGNLKGFIPSLVSTDLVFCNWLDAVADAVEMPFRDHALDAIVMVDVLHHLGDPLKFFEETQRCLRPGGRLIILDMAVTPVSAVLLKLFHPEPAHFKADFFDRQGMDTFLQTKEPWDGNQAMATAFFWRQFDRFQDLFPDFQVVCKHRIEWLLWPLSGGFSGRALIPNQAVDWFGRWSDWYWMCQLAGFRSLICLEHSPR